MFIANVLQPLIDACEAVLTFWHDLIGDFPNSWGWSIILLTFTVRILILPLTFKGVKAKQRMNQEVMAFYQREKVNPLGSCMPLLLQVPFFIALFYLLRSDSFKEDIADNPGFYAIDNLAEKVTGDPVLLGALIVLYVGTQLAASAVTMVSADPMQRRIMLALPFVFVVFIINFEAGRVFYWVTKNVWTIGQQVLLRKLYPKPEPIAPREDEDVSKPAPGKPPSPKPAGAAAAVAAGGSKGGGNGG